MTIDVLVADDQSLMRSAFRIMLGTTGDLRVVGEAATGLEAVDQTLELRPDVVLMDVRMPELDGIEATRRIVSKVASRVLILTTFDLDEYAYEGLRAGASGFMLKDAPPEALYEGIRIVAAGDAVVSPLTKNLVHEFVRVPGIRPPATAPADPLAPLTAREREVFEFMADGLSNAEIALKMYVGEVTVKTHVTRVLMKLGLRDRVHVVIFAYEQGLR